jgi:hypothetical protein
MSKFVSKMKKYAWHTEKGPTIPYGYDPVKLALASETTAYDTDAVRQAKLGISCGVKVPVESA